MKSTTSLPSSSDTLTKMENTRANTPSIPPLASGPPAAISISTTAASMESIARAKESITESFPMNGGINTNSYTKNSQFQRLACDFAKEMIKDAIIGSLDAETLALNTVNTFRIVDFGCSVGSNTFFAVQSLIESVKNKCSLQGLDLKKIEFQVFFNDHCSNDFNTLFALLPPDREYYAASAPGSFYSRVFPHSSISLAHSSYALQWLSRVPEDLSDIKSRAWNEGKIHYSGARNEVLNAYAAQFEKDMGVFISARAEEIVGGGMMVIIMNGTSDGVSPWLISAVVLFNLLESCLMDLADEELVDKTEIDSFNLPVYFPTTGEMKALIESNGCFSIEMMEVFNPRSQGNSPLSVCSIIMHARAAMEGLFTKHFGKKVTEKMFERAFERSEEVSHLSESNDPESTQLLIVLKRKLTI